MTGDPIVGHRLGLVGERDPAAADLVRRLIELACRTLPLAYRAGQFAHTMVAVTGPDGRRAITPRGESVRYALIALLGLRRLPPDRCAAVLGGGDPVDLLDLIMKRIDELTSPGDVALACWVAAEADHGDLPRALRRLRELDLAAAAGWPDSGDDQIDVVAAAWVITALVAARGMADVEQHLAAARRRLLTARQVCFGHLIGGRQAAYRRHVGSFADQVYPIQALARLHASSDDPAALAAAQETAAVICRAQGADGQWWWHYDARSGTVIEGYPVYSVHQHAMAPMALLDLAEAGGQAHTGPICRGLSWLAAPPETAWPLVTDDPPVIWRKVARDDRRKLVRGVRAAVSGFAPRLRLKGLDRLFPPGVIDYECRPYELGWLLFTWLPDLVDLPDSPEPGAPPVAAPEPA